MVQPTYRLMQETSMMLFTESIKAMCAPFSCGDGEAEEELNDFLQMSRIYTEKSF